MKLVKLVTVTTFPHIFYVLAPKILAPILVVYFELVLELETFSQIFKTAKVLLFHKSGNK